MKPPNDAYTRMIAAGMDALRAQQSARAPARAPVQGAPDREKIRIAAREIEQQMIALARAEGATEREIADALAGRKANHARARARGTSTIGHDADRAAACADMDRKMGITPPQPAARVHGHRLECGFMPPDATDAPAPVSNRRPAANVPAPPRRPAPPARRDSAREAELREMDQRMGIASTQPAVRLEGTALIFDAAVAAAS